MQKLNSKRLNNLNFKIITMKMLQENRRLHVQPRDASLTKTDDAEAIQK